MGKWLACSKALGCSKKPNNDFREGEFTVNWFSETSLHPCVITK